MQRTSCIPYIQLLILYLIDEAGPLCGYRIFQFLSRYGLVSQPATVYVAIKKLFEKGYIERKGTCIIKGKKLVRYDITVKGRVFKKELLDILNVINKAIKDASQVSFDTELSDVCV